MWGVGKGGLEQLPTSIPSSAPSHPPAAPACKVASLVLSSGLVVVVGGC